MEVRGEAGGEGGEGVREGDRAGAGHPMPHAWIPLPDMHVGIAASGNQDHDG